MFKSIREGSWWLHSETDSRWNRQGRSSAVGGFVMPQEATNAIEEMKKEFNEDPPDDLEYGYMKD